MKLFLYLILLGFCVSAHAASVTRIAVANGNFTDAATWAVVNQTGATELDSEAANSMLTTSPVDSAVFQPGVVTVDGIAIKIAHRTNAPSGTLTVTLRNSTLATDVISVTIDVSDIPNSDMSGFLVSNPTTGLFYQHGWLLVTFAGQLISGATDYTIRLSTSVANQVACYRNATTGNWSRMIRTTVTGAPAATDKLIICGERTGAGAVTARTVTMNNTDTTVFGQVVSATFCQSLVVSDRGTLAWDTSASVVNNLTVAGLFLIGEGGTVTLGTAAAPTPATSTNRLSFDCTATGDAQLTVHNGGTFTTHGAAMSQTWCWLLQNVAAGTTSTNYILLPRNGATLGWGDKDVLLFSASTRTYFQTDLRTNSTFVNVTNGTLPAGAGFTYAHPSTNTSIWCPVGNLTRNVQILGESLALNGVFYGGWNSTNSLFFTEFRWLGTGANGKEGLVNCYIGAGSMAVNSCSLWGSPGYGFYCDIPLVSNTVPVLRSNVIHATGSSAPGIYFNANSPGGPGIGNGTLIAENLLIGAGAQNVAALRVECAQNTNGAFLTVTNNTITSSLGQGIRINGQFTRLTMNSNLIHSCNRIGLWLSSYCATNTILRGNRFLRNLDAGAFVSAGDWTFADSVFFGNGICGLAVNNAQALLVTNCQFYGESNYNQTNGFTGGFPSSGSLNSSLFGLPGNSTEAVFIDSTFGTPVAHINADFAGYQAIADYRVRCYNVTMASTVEVSLPALSTRSWVGSEKHDGQAGSNSFWALGGKGLLDVTIYNSASPSLRVTPSSASVKFSMPEPYSVRVPVSSVAQRSVSVTVRKSASGDGTAYNGNQPRLIARAAYPLGVTADTVIATAIGSTGAWETLTGNTPAVSANGTLLLFVDCDGTAGWVNVDDWAFSPLASLGTEYWQDGFPNVQPGSISIGRR